jgi:transcriptional antiterminator RfaH
MTWYALHVHPQCEKAVQDALRRRGIEEFYPTFTERVSYSDRKKTVQRSLFPGYLFARSDERTLPAIGRIAMVVRILGDVNQKEMEDVQRLVRSGLEVEACAAPEIGIGESVIVQNGAFRGVQGTIMRAAGGQKLVVSISMLGRAVAVEMPADWLRQCA